MFLNVLVVNRTLEYGLGDDFWCSECQGNWSNWDRIERSGQLKQVFCGNLKGVRNQ